MERLFAGGLVPLRYVAAADPAYADDPSARVPMLERAGYPANPNGSPQGITALTTPDGRATIMMPHPERAFMTRQLSWHPSDWPADSPWLQMFVNAREWAGEEKHGA